MHKYKTHVTYKGRQARRGSSEEILVGLAADLSGLVVPITTPFDENDKIDKRMFIEHLDMLAAQGVKRILVNGTTAEFFSMTEDERKVCLKLAREYFPGVVMFHAGSSSLKQTI
ncbi:MAG: dihydrodipicolinate synthase family protein, partial [Phycisphaerae bacterium]|nr:dihydrodipicolinate synthase family protein [Phycisphaerae bacterium]